MFAWALLSFCILCCILPSHIACSKRFTFVARAPPRLIAHVLRKKNATIMDKSFGRFRGGSSDSAQETGPDFYDILGIPSDIPQEDMVRAYRRRAFKVHPDKNPSPNAHSEFIKLSEAFEVLKDAKRRQEYDFCRARTSTNKARRQEQQAKKSTEEDKDETCTQETSNETFEPDKQPRKPFTMEDALKIFNSFCGGSCEIKVDFTRAYHEQGRAHLPLACDSRKVYTTIQLYFRSSEFSGWPGMK
jgi:hypothetical protein